MTAALLDAAEVLTPEQRAELAKHFSERKGRGRW
jgi:Spy/CpxP family protein refolding chaperone